MLCEKYLFNILFFLCCSPFAVPLLFSRVSFSEVSLVRQLLDFLLALWLVCFSKKENQNFVYSYRAVLMSAHTFNKISAHHTYTIYEWCGVGYHAVMMEERGRRATAPRS